MRQIRNVVILAGIIVGLSICTCTLMCTSSLPSQHFGTACTTQEFFPSSIATMQQAFNRTTEFMGPSYLTAITVDGNGNVYAVGEVISNSSIFLVKYTSTGVRSWCSRSWSWATSESPTGVAVDSNGNTYISGFASRTSQDDAFVAKFNSSGGSVWNRTFSRNTIDEILFGITIDPAGSVYAIGTTNATSHGQYSMIVAKFAPNGTELWNTTAGKVGCTSYGWGIASDSSGNIIAAGQTNTAGAGGLDAFIVKFSPSGTQIWNRTWGGPNTDGANGVTTDSSKNIYFTGTTNSFGTGSDDAFLAKYSSDGTQLWNRTWGGPDYAGGGQVALDKSGNPVICGSTTNMGAGGEDAFLSKYSSTGDCIWNATWGYSSYDSGGGIANDSNGDIYLCGYYTNVTGYSNQYGFIAKYTPLPVPAAPVLGPITPATSTNGTFFLSWTASPGATSYDVYRYTHPITTVNESVSLVNTVLGTSGSDTVHASGTWYYVVSATNSSGESDISNCRSGIASITLLPPTITSVSPSVSSIGACTVNWTAIQGTASYALYYYGHPITGLNGTVNLLANYTKTSARVTNLANGTWYFAVTATNASGTTGLSNSMAVTVSIPAPELSGWSVSPQAGKAGTTFTFSVVYTDSNDIFPVNLSLILDGKPYSLNSFTGSILTGANYSSSAMVLSPGNHTYQFYAWDGLASRTSPLVSGPAVDNTPPTNPTSCTQTTGSTTSGTWQNIVTTPTFIWSGASDNESGIAGYYVYWGNSSTGTSSTFVTAAAYDPSHVAWNGTYYLRVQAQDRVGNNATSWATLYTFRYDAIAPTNPSSPCLQTNGTTTSNAWQGTARYPAFTWTGASDSLSGIAGYFVYWGTFAAGRSSTFVTSPAYDAYAPADGIYYLRVLARDGAGNNASAWTTLYVFMLDTMPPTNPVAPCEQTTGSTSNGTWERTVAAPTFAWTGAADGGSGIKGYYVYWGASPNGTSTTFTSAPSFSPSSVADGIHYLRVMTTDVVGNNATWVTLYTFMLDTTPPTNPSAPCTQSVGTTSNGTAQSTVDDPSFTWSGASDPGGMNASGIAGYYIYWGTSPTGTSSASQTQASFTASAVPANSTYYLRVMTKDAAGNNATWTTLYVFVYVVPGQHAPPTTQPLSPITLAFLIGLPAAAVCIAVAGVVSAKRKKKGKMVRKDMPKLDKGFGAKT